ncbi:MAG: uL22 family ribosomal protein [Candidatus Lokiarchaeota archaeon]
MPNWGYAFQEEKYDSERLAKAAGRDLRIKPKHAREVCAVIKGMKLEEAKSFLEKVIKIDQSVPFRRHKKLLERLRRAGLFILQHIEQELLKDTSSVLMGVQQLILSI